MINSWELAVNDLVWTLFAMYYGDKYFGMIGAISFGIIASTITSLFTFWAINKGIVIH